MFHEGHSCDDRTHGNQDPYYNDWKTSTSNITSIHPKYMNDRYVCNDLTGKVKYKKVRK